VTILNSCYVTSSETEVRNGIKKEAKKHTNFHQLNSKKLFVVYNSAVSEGVHAYSQIENLKISISTLRRYCWIFGLTVCLSAVMVGIF
jgi:hypothetical protein